MEIATTSRRPRRTSRRLTSFVSALLTVLAIAFMAPTAFGLQRFVITGSSMEDTIGLGSVVFSEVVPVSELEVGDVITYTPPASSGVDELVTHRIVSIKGTTFRTKGDAVPQRDPWKFELGGATQPRVKFAVPYVGYLFVALADPATRRLVIGVPAGLVVLTSFVQVLKILRRRPSASRERPPVTVAGPGPTPASERSPATVGG